MIKATAGGGGRGMRLAMKESEFYSLLKQASQEVPQAFPCCYPLFIFGKCPF